MTRETTFITLGTSGGPMPNPLRAQPAHLLCHADGHVLLDCGEGAIDQIGRAGIDFREVHDVVLTHHHFDHIGSLFACLGRNMMLQRQQPLNIFGPAGTELIVERLCAACDVPQEIGFGVPGQVLPHPRDFVTVTEIAPGDAVRFGAVRMTCCENTHYRTEDKLGQDGYLSLSLRFDAPDRSICLSGDTGPCGAVEEFAKGVDLFIGELMDFDLVMRRLRATSPDVPKERLETMLNHLAPHHLTPEQLGEMAARAGAKHLVAVHLPKGVCTPDNAETYAARVRAVFAGKVSIGADLAVY